MTPYQREMQLMPVIHGMEKRGVRVDVHTLRTDMDFYFDRLSELDAAICRKLRCDVDIDSGDSLADALESAGLSKGFASTPTGKRSTAKDSLISAVADPELLGHLLVRAALATCLRTFYQPWFVAAHKTGRMFTKWNQIRNYSDNGARTGRLSSSPNYQNIPVEWEKLQSQLKAIGYELPYALPKMRKYLIPDDYHVFVGRDYKSQEMRLLAHFAGGKLLETLQADPNRDVHTIAAELANIPRSVAKTLGFAILYGAGVGRIAEGLGVPVSEATRIKHEYLRTLPEIKLLQEQLTSNARIGIGVTTLGGRRYMAEPPKVIDGRLMTFEYKLTNYLIQGSAADQTKEAMHKYARTTKHGHIVLSVHDQLVIEVPETHLEEERALLERAMTGAYADVLRCAFPSDEAVGYTFGALK